MTDKFYFYKNKKKYNSHMSRSKIQKFPNDDDIAKAIQEIGKLCDGNSIDYIFFRRGRTNGAIAGFNIGN